MLLWPRRLPFLQPSSQSRENRPQPSDVTSFGPFPSQWTWKRTTPTFWCDSVSHAEFFCPTWKGLATKPLLWESVQTKPNLISRELIRKVFMWFWEDRLHENLIDQKDKRPLSQRWSLKRHCEGNQRKHWGENGKETESWSIWQKLSGWLGTKRGWNILQSSQLSCNCVYGETLT